MTDRYEVRPYRAGRYAVKDYDMGGALVTDAAGVVMTYPADSVQDVVAEMNEWDRKHNS